MLLMARKGSASLLALLASVAVTSHLHSAKAAEDACLSAPVDGQKLRRADKLIEAHDRFTTCARKTCPARIVQECTRWLHEVDDILPSIVAAARDGRGADLLDVRLSVDDQPPADIGPRAIPLNPGPHKLVFHREGMPDIAEDVLLREGEKNREVTATFKAPEPPPPPPAPPPPPTPVIVRPVPVAVWVLGGVTVVGGAGFATFAALGVTERGRDCAAAGCTQSQKDSIETKFRIGDISLAVGAVALVTGTVLFLVRPKVEKPATLGYLGLSPEVLLERRGGVVVLGTRF
jgi:hypothetical protein